MGLSLFIWSAAHPAIFRLVGEMAQYDTVFLGYPIWTDHAPTVMSTFLKRYDFSGRTIIPFCTSNSSGISSRATNSHSRTPPAT